MLHLALYVCTRLPSEYFSTLEFAWEFTMGLELSSLLLTFRDSLMYQGSGVDALPPLYDCGLQEKA